MKILALDSSTSIASIAFLEYQSSGEEKILFHFNQTQQRTNSSIFFEGLETVLQQCGKPDRVVVGLGPGSYNGLRSSIAAAQGLASACNIELIGLPSILGLEAGARECWVVGDARGGQYWLAALSHHQLLEEPFLLAPADLPDHLKRYPHFSLVASQELPNLPSSLKLTIQTPNAGILARQGKHATPSASLEPLYLKQPHITKPRP
ncbi:MAG: tRNA (adenosine(37)-N6)-threonylcarbamoyltransferase complex dimerization subunit type 1 TsaB [Chthoniobacterales bacterium]|nr:tRNA (adenosine(37)-N6)-threonylcarbamoyltransferase complex dimerization subunit type 1 TsaB [Chthoniobacterales bacterium]